MRKAVFALIVLGLLVLGLACKASAQDYGLSDGFQVDTTTYFTLEQGQTISTQLYGLLEQWAESGDPSGYTEQLEPNVRYIRKGDNVDVTGVDATIAAMGSMLQLATDISFAVDSVRVSGAYVVSTGTMTGTVTGTNYRLEVPFGHAVLINVQTGKVAAIGDGTDLDALRSQLATAMATAVANRSWGAIKSRSQSD